MAGACEAGADVCGCAQHSDCAANEDGNACNGTLFCNKATSKCQLNPATVVKCPDAQDTQCVRNVCEPGTGKCQATHVNTGKLCADGNACTGGTKCTAGKCKGGENKCACTNNANCAGKDDGGQEKTSGWCSDGVCIGAACPPGWESMTMDVGGKETSTCSALIPTWGLDGDTPQLGYTVSAPDASKATEKVVLDKRTKLTWQQVEPSNTMTHDEAAAYCDKLVYGGSGDWRHPSLHELLSLVDFNKTSGARVDTNAFPHMSQKDRYSTRAHHLGRSVHFQSGVGHTVGYGAASWQYRVLCVRGP